MTLYAAADKEVSNFEDEECLVTSSHPDAQRKPRADITRINSGLFEDPDDTQHQRSYTPTSLKPSIIVLSLGRAADATVLGERGTISSCI